MRRNHGDLQERSDYWYKFMWNDEVIRRSSRQTNQNIARQMEASHRSALAKGEVGIRRRESVPTLADFIKSRIRGPAFEASTSGKTWVDYYRPNLNTISGYTPPGVATAGQDHQRKGRGLRSVAQIQRFAGEFSQQLATGATKGVAVGGGMGRA